MKLWTLSFFIASLENALTTGLSTFAGSLVLTTTPTVKDVIAASVAGGIAVAYTFAKNLGGVQAVKASVAAAAK